MVRKAKKRKARTIEWRGEKYFIHSEHILLRSAKKVARKAMQMGYKIRLEKKTDIFTPSYLLYTRPEMKEGANIWAKTRY